jgi:hypothetical protein
MESLLLLLLLFRPWRRLIARAAPRGLDKRRAKWRPAGGGARAPAPGRRASPAQPASWTRGRHAHLAPQQFVLFVCSRVPAARSVCWAGRRAVGRPQMSLSAAGEIETTSRARHKGHHQSRQRQPAERSPLGRPGSIRFAAARPAAWAVSAGARTKPDAGWSQPGGVGF